MNKVKVVILAAILSLSVGCVGLGFTLSPADGRLSIDFQAQDCISNNFAGRTVAAIPKFGDWALLNWGCPQDGEIIVVEPED